MIRDLAEVLDGIALAPRWALALVFRSDSALRLGAATPPDADGSTVVPDTCV